jgi:hypothetical protein
MRSAIILFVLLAAVLTLDLPYQAHGFNDLDYFLQLVRKGRLKVKLGVKAFKLDLSMVAKDNCLQHSSWKEDRN